MAKISINTTKRVIPMIYAYSTPEIERHNGCLKIGYTEKQTVEERIKQQLGTADVKWIVEWKGNAIFEDGTGAKFHDTDFHAYLRKLGFKQKKDTEWFRIGVETSRNAFYDFKNNRGILDDLDPIRPYTLRTEQNDAVTKTIDYLNKWGKGEYLWNAKPRFGKTLSVYDFVQRIGAKNVLIVTNRPAIANSWYDDFVKFLGTQSGYQFVSHVSALKGKPYCIDRSEYKRIQTKYNCIEFVSLQDLKGSLYFGGEYDKLQEVAKTKWDVLVIDEAHEGIDTYKTDIAFDKIDRTFTLHLSGTPFKALANDKFNSDAIYNWTYADEQRAKRDWTGDTENPYKTLPKLNLYTYQMSEIIQDEIEQGTEIDGENVDYAFDLNEFFKEKNGEFLHEKSVDKLLDALTTQEKFPFSTPELRDELKHTFWLLNRVESAKLLKKKLEQHPIFSEYEIVLAAGNEKQTDEEQNSAALDKVRNAIKKYDKTITLSVGQLTTGVTIKEWTAVLMLSSIKSPSLYMQAAFRAQNPCLFERDGQFLRKENSYVFDFDPARTLIIFEQFANDLSTDTAKGLGDTAQRKKNIKELLNFFPVVGEDTDGKMIELDAEKVLSIPRKIKSREVVKRGFMSDFLFQNIHNLFHAPQEILDILDKLPETKEGELFTPETGDQLSINENGEVKLDEGYIIGRAQGIFGDKIYAVSEEIPTYISDIKDKEPTKEVVDTVKDTVKEQVKEAVISPLIAIAKQEYKKDFKSSDEKKLSKTLEKQADIVIEKTFADYTIKTNELKKEAEETLKYCRKDEREKRAKELKEKQDKLFSDFQGNLTSALNNIKEEAEKEIIETVEVRKKEAERDEHMEKAREHLRGFSRTIPSFLMAYGSEGVTLETFDKVIPADVFLEVTSITIDDFILLRDGGEYKDTNTGEIKKFEGHLFDPVVFNDSIKEFMELKKKLKNYFEEGVVEDIFDYIPPQKTNQIYTPKKVVKKMVDMLEEENKGCFDNPDSTFLDPYMKSGLYIAEIVKRLYQSKKIQKIYPDREKRLQHIFKNQVYGLAPTPIIYAIATNFLLGFADDVTIQEHNFRECDAVPYVKEDTLEECLDKLYSKKK